MLYVPAPGQMLRLHALEKVAPPHPDEVLQRAVVDLVWIAALPDLGDDFLAMRVDPLAVAQSDLAESGLPAIVEQGERRLQVIQQVGVFH